MKLHFLGAVGTVTGSKYILECKGKNILIDCGLYQGYKLLRQRNWRPFPYPIDKIDAVVLTHAHLDHSGYLPALVAKGYSGPIYATRATRDLCEILLTDSAHLQEEEAKYANRRGSSKHSPALPLYDKSDVLATMPLFKNVAFNQETKLGNVDVCFIPGGHILGAGSVCIRAEGKTVLFSGDIGRSNDVIMAPPQALPEADVVVMESTYGDRNHETTDPKELIADIVSETAAKGGSVLIPSFAVGRAQALMHILTQLKASEKIPPVPIFLNSPMAINVAELYCEHHKDHKLSKREVRDMCDHVNYARTVEESIALVNQVMPSIIISASGMATGGRVLHHLQSMVSDPKHSILFAGYQAPGTRGWRLCEGESTVKIFGQTYDVRASVQSIDILSAHADQHELLAWLSSMPRKPQKIFLTHGENSAVDQLRLCIQEELGYHCTIPEFLEVHTL